MIVEYSTRFPFVSEIEVEGGEGEWRKPLEKSRYSDVARFTIRLLPGVSRSKANKTVFIALAGEGGRGGGGASSMFTRRCGARLEETIVVVSPRVLILVRNGGVPIYGDV